MKNQKKFFFNKEDNAIKELLDNKKMQNIVGGLEVDYSKAVYGDTHGGTTYTRMKPKN